jgi:hypothetical protein
MAIFNDATYLTGHRLGLSILASSCIAIRQKTSVSLFDACNFGELLLIE